MQQPEVAEGDHAFRFVVVVRVVARRSVAGDSRRFFTRVARFGLRFVRVELDGERQAHVEDFQQKRQAIAEALPRLGAEGARGVFGYPGVQRQLAVLRFDGGWCLRVVTKPQFGSGLVAGFAPQQLRDVVVAAPGVGLDGAVQTVKHGGSPCVGVPPCYPFCGAASRRLQASFSPATGGATRLKRCCNASSPVKKAAAASKSSMRATGRMTGWPFCRVRTSTPSSESCMAAMAS